MGDLAMIYKTEKAKDNFDEEADVQEIIKIRDQSLYRMPSLYTLRLATKIKVYVESFFT